MVIKEVSKFEYEKLTDKNNIFYNRTEFSELNKYKVDKINYLLACDKKNRFAFTLGSVKHDAYSPFSAPFALPLILRENMSIAYYEKFVDLLEDWLISNDFIKVKIILPPTIYNESEVSKWINTFFRKNYFIENVELNQFLDLSKDNYMEMLQYNARKNLNIALSSELDFVKAISEEEYILAYQVIKSNRDSKGYPLRMSYEQISNTLSIVRHDVFLIKKGKVPIASAFIFAVTEDIVQIIYWGGVLEYSQYKPINYLAYMLTKYYQDKNIKFIDIGPSTENSIPNVGLCDFKDSIGTKTCCKYLISRKFT